MADYESVLCLKNEVFVYHIPARPSNRGYRAADWKLDEPDWTGRLRVVAKGRELNVKLEDKNSGELFALCPVESYPSSVVEQVLDSSRYFVIRIQNSDGRHAFIGLGFADRGDSFDLLVSLQDHFKQVKRDNTIRISENPSTVDTTPKLDFSFKEGQTIKLNFSTKRTGDEVSAAKARPKAQVGASPALLPPPPGGSKVPMQQSRQVLTSSSAMQSPVVPIAGSGPAVLPSDSFKQPLSTSLFRPPVAGVTNQPVVQVIPKSSNIDLLLDLSPPSTLNPVQHTAATFSADEWNDFSSAMATKLTIAPNAMKKPDPNIVSWENFE